MRRSSPSWFDTLRRDRGLFALVCALAMLIGLLQPVVAAQNTQFSDLLVICNADGSPAAPADHQQQGPDCPLCPTGHLCAGPANLASPAEIPPLASSLRASGRLLRPGLSRLPGSSAQSSPPSIRAPPLSA